MLIFNEWFSAVIFVHISTVPPSLPTMLTTKQCFRKYLLFQICFWKPSRSKCFTSWGFIQYIEIDPTKCKEFSTHHRIHTFRTQDGCLCDVSYEFFYTERMRMWKAVNQFASTLNFLTTHLKVTSPSVWNLTTETLTIYHVTFCAPNKPIPSGRSCH